MNVLAIIYITLLLIGTIAMFADVAHKCLALRWPKKRGGKNA